MDWPGLFQLTDVLDEHGSTITQVPLSPLSLSLLLLLGILRCCYNTCTSSWHLSVCRLGFLFVGGEMDESLLKRITKAEMKINWTANFSQILQPSTRRNLRIWTAACNTWENMDVFRKWSMQQHWTSKPNHSCILHEIKQYQLPQCVPCFCLSLCLVFHTEPKTLLLLNGAFSVWFMWISCGVYVECRRYEDILKDTLENVLDA